MARSEFPFSWLHNDLKVAVVGPKLDLTYEYEVAYFFQFGRRQFASYLTFGMSDFES